MKNNMSSYLAAFSSSNCVANFMMIVASPFACAGVNIAFLIGSGNRIATDPFTVTTSMLLFCGFLMIGISLASLLLVCLFMWLCSNLREYYLLAFLAPIQIL